MKTSLPEKIDTIHGNPPEGSDLELMAYFDGELEEPRRSEVERLLAEDGEAKVTALALGAAMVRERFSEVEPPQSMTDAIMDAIGREEGASVQVDRQAETRREGAHHSGDGPASNDNGRFIFRLAAIAAAAAATLFFWGRADLDPDASKVAQNAPQTAVTALSSRGSLTASSGGSPQTGRPESGSGVIAEVEEEAPGVEVAAVDFGSRTGAIYYVSGANNGAATPVVWLSDD